MATGRVKKITNGSDEVAIKWLYRIDRGLAKREAVAEDRWTANEHFEDLKQWNGTDETKELVAGSGDQVTINKLSANIRTKRAAICAKNPKAKFSPKTVTGWKPIQVPIMGEDGTPQLDEMGQVVVREIQPHKVFESLFNGIITKAEFGLDQTITRLNKAGELAYGALFTGYRATYAKPKNPENKDMKIKIDRENGVITGLDQFARNPVDGTIVMDDDGNPIRKDFIPIGGEYFIDWQHYRNIIIDPDGGNDFMKHSWVAIEEWVPLQDMKDDKLLSNTDDLVSTGSRMDEEFKTTADLNDWAQNSIAIEEDKMVRKFTIFDFKNDRMIVLADGHGEILRDNPTPKGIVHGPLSFYRLNEIIGQHEEFYPRPPASDALPLISEYNQARTYLRAAQRHSVRKALTETGALSDDQIAVLQNDVDMAIVTTNKASQYGLDKTIHMISPPPVNPELYNLISTIRLDLDEIFGSSGESKGQSASRTATAIQEIEKYSGSRLDFDRNIQAACIEDAFNKLAHCIKANMTDATAVEIVGEDGKSWTAIIDQEMIDIDFDLEINLEDMVPVNEAMQSARMMEMTLAAGQNPWLFADEETARELFHGAGITNERFIQAVVRLAKAQVEALNNPQPKVPNASPAKNTGEAIAQTGAGMQTRNPQGAP